LLLACPRELYGTAPERKQRWRRGQPAGRTHKVGGRLGCGSGGGYFGHLCAWSPVSVSHELLQSRALPFRWRGLIRRGKEGGGRQNPGTQLETIRSERICVLLLFSAPRDETRMRIRIRGGIMEGGNGRRMRMVIAN